MLPTILIAEALHTAGINEVFSAMGKGEDTVSVACVAADNNSATWETEPTHYIAQDMSAEDSDVAIWQAMCSGDLPPLPNGVQWGEDGVISSVNAQNALTGHLVVASAAGLDTNQKREEFLAGVLGGAGLKRRPDPPI